MDLISINNKLQILNLKAQKNLSIQTVASSFIFLLEIAQKESILIEDITEDMLIKQFTENNQ
jgi:hypothetical protein